MKTKKSKFFIDVFDCKVNIIITNSIKRSLNYYLRRDNQDLLTYDPSGMFYKPDTDYIGEYFIFLCYEDLSVDIYNHEKSHLIDEILLDRDIETHNEVRSYLDGFVSRKIDKFFRKKNIKLKNKR